MSETPRAATPELQPCTRQPTALKIIFLVSRSSIATVKSSSFKRFLSKVALATAYGPASTTRYPVKDKETAS